MNHRCLLLCAGVFAAPGIAQKTDIAIQPATQPLQFTIESSSKLATQTRMTIDGEERTGRGGGRGGGSRTIATVQKVVFEEGPQGEKWRKYSVAEATVTSPGREGEERTNTVTGALSGKRIYIVDGDGGVVVREGDAKGEPLPRELVQGLPVAMALSGLTPSGPVDVGQEFELGSDFAAALRAFVHPVRPAPGAAPDGERAPEGERGEPAQGGERGQRGERGRGNRGGRATRDAALAALANGKLTCKAKGKLVEVSDGLARIAIDAVFSGEGTPSELGVGGFGRGGGEGNDAGTAKIALKVAGTLVVDTAQHRLHQLGLKGDLKSSSEMKNEGEQGVMESKSSTEGSFDLAVSCKPNPTKDGAGK